MSKLKFVGNTTKPGNPLWDEYVDEDTGQSTMEIHTVKTNYFCREHDYEFIDSNGNIKCKNCPMGGRLALGFQNLKNGKIVDLKPR